MRTTTAVLAGAVLFTLPFQLYLHGGSHHDGRAAPHADHDARHGGTLVMVDDHHLEIVTADGRIAVYVTDALRRPVQPSGGSALFNDGTSTTFAWQAYRLVAEAPRGFVWADYEIRLENSVVLAIRVPAPDREVPRLRGPG
jgi:hypothetical protein